MATPHSADLEDRVAIVTGANHGIGAAVAAALAAQGAAVLITYLRLADVADAGTYAANRAQGADAVVNAIRGRGGQVAALEADLADPDTPARLFDHAEAVFGKPAEILVNNASGWLADTFKPDADDRFGRTLNPVTAQTADRLFAVDARAPALLIAEFARRLVARGGTWGRIVGLTSGGFLGFPEEVSYGAAKAAQVNYTMSAARELAPYGVTANVVHPPVTDTGWVTPEVRSAVGDRVATPDEVAEVVVYLCSEASRWLTANVLTLR